MANTPHPLTTKKPPSFFKIYLPEHNSNKLLIPPPFSKNFNGKIFEKVTLRNLFGNVWHVKVEKIKGRLFITRGWKQYASDHSLVRGNLLIFAYQGNSVFIVKVYGVDGCLQREPAMKAAATITYERSVCLARGAAGLKLTDAEPLKEVNEYDNSKAKQHTGSALILEKQNGLSESKISGTTSERALAKTPDAAPRNILWFFKPFCNKMYEFVGVPTFILGSCKVEPPQDVIIRNKKGHFLRARLIQLVDRVGVKATEAELKDFWQKCNFVLEEMLEFLVILGKDRRIVELVVSKKSS